MYGALEDKFAYEEFKKLISEFNITKIYETGTYLGWSTLKLSTFNLPVYTIEVNDYYIVESYHILKDKKNVHLSLGESPKVLDLLCTKNDKNCLFFLDAHWNDSLPILDELEVIKRTKNPVIVIHDFFVPGGNKIRSKLFDGYGIVDDSSGSKFGFDSYGDITLNYEYIKDKLDEVYPNGYDYHYTEEIDCVDSGLIYIYPKNKQVKLKK